MLDLLSLTSQPLDLFHICVCEALDLRSTKSAGLEAAGDL